jgi:hypothetical protein
MGRRFIGRSRRWRTGFAIVAALAVTGGIAYAAIPDGSGVFSACVQKSNGGIRLVDPAAGSCQPNEKQVQWSSSGPAGPQGPQGAVGPAGPAGPQGPSGGLAGYEIVHTADTYDVPDGFSEGVHTSESLCPSGKVPVGGGGDGSISGHLAPLVYSETVEINGQPGWRIEVGKSDGTRIVGGDKVRADVEVICVNGS